MRYTRYDIKKGHKSNFTFFLIIALVLVFAFVLGTVIFNIASPNNIKKNNIIKKGNTSIVKSKDNKNSSSNYIVIQRGIYAKKENASEVLSSLTPYGNAFTIEDNGKTRVFLGIYEEDEGIKLMKKLTDNKIDNSKMTFAINKKDLCDAEISEIITAYIKIVNKLSEKDVKSVKTEEIKKWMSSLDKVNKDSSNIKTLNNLKEHINKLPKDLTKDQANKSYSFIYKILQEINNK
ncbi:SPOR domain-containing protein [Clostridium sporogenes]|nr:SPOR domain-containing protein [Clostridium sporogenes]NFS25421.1 SPOR domain-containing protein [Clostridium sporogenes]